MILKNIIFLTILSVKVSLVFVFGTSLVLAQQSAEAQVPFSLGLGQQKFESNCASCHGVQAKGTDSGPPLLHAYYKPSHHDDRAFYSAILNGSTQHHWNFGNMLPVPGVGKKEIPQIVAYVRWMQRQVGIE